jgi:hypothetical protein
VRRRRLLVLAVVAAVVAAGGVTVIRTLLGTTGAAPPICNVGPADTGYLLDPDQAANAATIAAVAKRELLPDHAVTVALAAALQESKLRNLGYGDRDSVGLFQQRPSQGWGTPAQLTQPAFAAAAFFAHLRQVEGWQALTVADAAQAVQHSADGSAYGGWEAQARALARALTGEDPGGLSCRFADHPAPRAAALANAAATDLGPNVLHRTGSAAQDWTVAEWLVAHALRFGVVSVSVRGRTWTSATGRWRADPGATRSPPSYRLAPVRAS